MRRICPLGVILVALQFSGPIVRAESSIDALEDELKQAQQQHQDASSKQFTDLINALDQAIQSPDAALQLYQSAGGNMPDPAPVLTAHAEETPSEKALRDAQDAAVNAALASVVQLHCGLMRFAVFFVQKPDEQGLHDAWIVWLKQAALMYPQAGLTPPDTRSVSTPPPADSAQPTHHDRERERAKANLPDYVKDLKNKAVRDSIISAYFGYNAWGDKEQGSWAVREIPHLYRVEVLDPLRTKPSADTIAAWDTYIAMKNADETDRDKWDNVDYPALQFQRGKDDFYAEPSDDKLETLVTLVKNNPTNPDLDNWIAQVKQMIQDYRAFKSTGAQPQPAGSTNATPTTPAGA
ncbi:MAG: hypothetical protein LV481_10840 [Methylacidiphilales bacterium]|nr:hypothetical protein [Candidatus Methylacidiphilales bacterium]